MEIRAEPDFEARRFEMGFRNLLLSEGRHSASSWEAVWIQCRRLAMSLDNVLAVARGDLPLVLLLGYVAGEMIIDHPLGWRWLGAAEGA